MSKRKAESDSKREFNEQWENELLFIAGPSGKLVCIVCENTLSQNRRHDMNRHYKTRHQTDIEGKLKLVLGSELQKEYVTKKKEEIRRRQNVLKVLLKMSTIADGHKSSEEGNKDIDQNEPHEEYQYLNLIRQILKTGNKKGDRTGTGVLSIFGAQMRFSLRDGQFPLLTTKKVFLRGIAEELLWFIRGSTNAKELSEKKVYIWDGNSTREFLDNLGLTDREEGDLGPVYGFQWRHFGATYSNMHADYTEKGIDQLKEVIEKIKNNPDDRRIIMCAWNPADIPKMALPPCHCFCQFYVANGELSCLMYQRSADMGLGVPFNIASYALLTHIMAHVTDLKAGEFIHTMGDAHIYQNHEESVKEQLSRVPMPFPKIEFKRKVSSIDDFKMEDFEIVGYKSHPSIKMKMAV